MQAEAKQPTKVGFFVFKCLRIVSVCPQTSPTVCLRFGTGLNSHPEISVPTHRQPLFITPLNRNDGLAMLAT